MIPKSSRTHYIHKNKFKKKTGEIKYNSYIYMVNLIIKNYKVIQQYIHLLELNLNIFLYLSIKCGLSSSNSSISKLLLFNLVQCSSHIVCKHDTLF